MHRFFVLKDEIVDGYAHLSKEDTDHALKVLRLKEGDEILLCDGQDREYPARIVQKDKSNLTLSLGEGYALNSEPRTRITLYQGVPKAGKMEYLVQKGTEIGICRFVPFYSERCEVKPGKADKSQRYGRVAYEAAKQSHRGAIPEVDNPVAFEGMLKMLSGHSHVIAAWEEEKALSIKVALRTCPDARDMAIVIGPEGGFSQRETQALAQVGARVVTLGPRILRTETAGAVLAAVILYEMDDMQ
jgi:16S rRNA (uracil1498-N3)-methyltransferase